MVTVTPTVGAIAVYQLNEQDVAAINRRRQDAAASGVAREQSGVQVHFGNAASVGQRLPLLIVRVWGDNPESSVNGQVFLDGNDTLWVSSRPQGDGPGMFTFDAA